MSPKRISRGEKVPSKPRTKRPKRKKAKTKIESSALTEVMGVASNSEESHGEHAPCKLPDAPPEEGGNPRFSYERRSRSRDWASPEFSCTKVVYSVESSQEEDDASEGSAQAANDKNQAEGDVPNAPADPDTKAEEQDGHRAHGSSTGQEPDLGGRPRARPSFQDRPCFGGRRARWEETCCL
ncbi:uncharacterized protein IUM83_03733 [Phytophthora cinnamomi]|uniref:uncharacterized protein n=1 Tax=Phytophthora cinnamomi TaxID=4785 RepID=UPI00355AC125|nr:hypothetical protein IUM83_03733 [Phytophthora cinnamomi]